MFFCFNVTPTAWNLTKTGPSHGDNNSNNKIFPFNAIIPAKPELERPSRGDLDIIYRNTEKWHEKTRTNSFGHGVIFLKSLMSGLFSKGRYYVYKE